MANKKVVDQFFTAVDEKCNKCKLCLNTYKAGNGFTNCMRHLEGCHKKELTLFKEATAVGLPKLDLWVKCNDKVTNMFKWISFIVEKNVPFSWVEDPEVRKITTLADTTRQTVKKYMKLLHAGVLAKIKASIPTHFGLIFDGWSDGAGHHAVALFVTYFDYTAMKVVRTLLAVQPLLDRTNQNADNHIETFAELLHVHLDRKWSNVLFIAGDNCSTNKAIADRTDTPFVGCLSHRLNLASEAFLADHTGMLDQVHAVMTTIKHSPNKCGQLALYTDLKPVIRQDTRWTSAFAMVNRYLEIAEILENHAEQIGGRALAEKVLNVPQRVALAELKTRLDMLHAITLAMQAEDLTMGGARDLLDGLLHDFPEECVRKYLTPYGDKVPNPAFASGVAKVCRRQFADLEEHEKEAISDLKLQAPPCPQVSVGLTVEEEATLSYAAQAVLRAKRQRADRDLNDQHGKLDFVPPTSNVVERLFSKAKLCFTSIRQSMSPETLNMLLVLRCNRSLWDMESLLAVYNE
jgi:hypothetical protein